MITSEEGFLIATPTKCATTTLEAITRRHMRNAGADGDLFRIMDWDSPRRQHRMALPPNIRDRWGDGNRLDEVDWTGGASGEPEWGDSDRFLFVRNPYTRYMSMYTYLSAPANYSQWGALEVQGHDWGGHDKSKIKRHPKMSFEQFLYWLVDQRRKYSSGYWVDRRGDLTTGFAYRSPWVWVDSLTFSLAALRDQPGGGEVVGLLRMESMWDDLREVLGYYAIADSIDLSPVHANRSTAYGKDGAVPGSKEFWGGIRCARKAFDGRTFTGNVWERSGCECAACALGVAEEASGLGYVGGDTGLWLEV